ncbi:MAG: hypothetical protein H7039_21615 [Bryobacteraceae bacterium]|nr:hypothetical protein [Bryobacteraceae bacterium]
MKTSLTYPLVLVCLNVLLAEKLFRVEYSAWLHSNEGTFIAIARQIAAHPFDLLWWPHWDCGLPFQHTYLPLLHIIVGAWSRLAGVSAALSFHQVCAVFFCLGPVAVYALAHTLTGKRHTSFIAALIFSLTSPGAWLVPMIRYDLGSGWNLRRLQILAYYGEGPHIASMALIPLALLFAYLVLHRERWSDRVLTGLFTGLAVLANAFAATILVVAFSCLLATVRTDRLIRNIVLMGTIGLLAYVWVSPLFPTSVIAAIRVNSPSVDGDFRFNAASLAALSITFIVAATIWLLTRRQEPHLRFFVLYAWWMFSIVIAGTWFHANIVPQPHRYQIAMDLGICLALVFCAELWLRETRFELVRKASTVVLAVSCVVLLAHNVRYARRIIQSTDITKTAAYRIATWVDRNRNGQRVMIGGAYSFYFNIFTDTPQLHGGHDPMLPNQVMRIATFTVYTGMDAGDRDTQLSTLWLQALGAHAVSVPGPQSAEFYKPFVNPRKFEGVLKVLWREGDDTIYEVPARSKSLAHAVPEQALVKHQPENGLDSGETQAYVAAINDSAISEAKWTWLNRHAATVEHPGGGPGQVVSVQTTYHPGWIASVDGRPVPTGADGLGFLVIRPACAGPCRIDLEYDGGRELKLASAGSLAVTFGVVAFAIRRRLRRHSPTPDQH